MYIIYGSNFGNKRDPLVRSPKDECHNYNFFGGYIKL